ncbi:S1-like domain-containing RNA-binding protein [Lacticaseibacillus brantae]|uniref:RNA-binding protein, S1-like domain n=1 Tax=Lacticaseibacillus brantae DSM 23927 TaxID=1423727 RepID=A0A0R2AZ62_9LACO|nr:S1-like domain-containing RNA-binding protein [Lacticaseibacillus brantae]KRM72589.1 RNA-binding protein, S1-like domain [Lacticaseibacillus brantae DSM 23927]
MDFNGQIVTATVSDQNETQVFAQYQGVTLAIEKEELEQPVDIGADITGFAYEDMHGHARMQITPPKVNLDHYAFVPVVEVRRDLGVFVDIGLKEKDIVVSLDQLPQINRLWPARGDRLMVHLVIDKKQRLWGELADEQTISAVANRAKPDLMNADVTATTYRLKMAGTHVLTDDFYLGFIHPDERDAEPRLGEVIKGRVIGVRPDGSLNLSLRPRAFEAIDDDAAMVLAVLQHSQDGSMPFTDKSDPEAIQQAFGISKGAFKRALGHLMKAKMITQKDGITTLIKS